MISPIKKVLIPNANHHAHFIPRAKMRSRSMRTSIKPRAAWPTPKLPIDWYGNLVFPIDGNDQYGDCGEAMAAHGDNTFTGMNGSESTFDVSALVSQYEKQSGGDNGLSEQDVVAIWKSGIGGNKQAVILDALDLDPTSSTIAHAAIGSFFGLCLGLSVPDAWINDFDPNGGSVWDAPATPDEQNGHFVWINGVDAQGRYRVQTWGSYAWLTQAGFELCEPSIFCVFSPRFFGPSGVDPTGATFAQKAALWQSVGGSAIVQPGPGPAPTPTPQPVPGPVPVPVPVSGDIKTVNDMILNLEKYSPSQVIAIQGELHWRVPVLGEYQGIVMISEGAVEHIYAE